MRYTGLTTSGKCKEEFVGEKKNSELDSFNDIFHVGGIHGTAEACSANASNRISHIPTLPFPTARHFPNISFPNPSLASLIVILSAAFTKSYVTSSLTTLSC